MIDKTPDQHGNQQMQMVVAKAKQRDCRQRCYADPAQDAIIHAPCP
jgi:hypothetical protein